MAHEHALALPALQRLHADLLALEVTLLARPGLCHASTSTAVVSCTPTEHQLRLADHNLEKPLPGYRFFLSSPQNCATLGMVGYEKIVELC